MPEVVGIRFKEACKIYYFDPGGFTLEEGEDVIVETARGRGYGWVTLPNHTIDDEEVVTPLRTVVRKATNSDRARMRDNRGREDDARRLCQRKANRHGLEMQVVDAEYAFDGSQITFYFTADGRVDFRQLVRDLAGTFHTRIELRQIGVRDEAKIIGGIGACGRACCCTTFLADFTPITIRMAKRQNLSLNPAKISGLCGRLMCCLQYEDMVYEKAQEELPDQGDQVETSDGTGRVIRCDCLERRVHVRLQDGQVNRYSAEEVSPSCREMRG